MGTSRRFTRFVLGSLTAGVMVAATAAMAAPAAAAKDTSKTTKTTAGPAATAGENCSENEIFTAGKGGATPQVDLAIAKTGSPAEVAVNKTVHYTLTATNNGPNDGTNVVVTDSLPANVQAVGAITPPAGVTCDRANLTITCQLGTLKK